MGGGWQALDLAGSVLLRAVLGGGLVWRRQQQHPLPSHPDLALKGLTQPCLMIRGDGVRRGRRTEEGGTTLAQWARDQENHLHFFSKQTALCKEKLESTSQTSN